MPTAAFETLGGVRVNVLKAAREGAPRALLLAPWPLTLQSFGAAWPTLTAALDVVAIDLPGFGHSDPLPGPSSPSRLADFLISAFDHFGLDRAHLVGTDVGVPVALSLATRHADRLQSLVLCDGPGTTDAVLNPDLRRMVGSGFFRWGFAQAPGIFLSTSLRKGYTRRQPAPAAVEDFRTAIRIPGRLAGAMRFLATYPEQLPVIEAALASTSVPTLLLWGASDVFVPPDNTRLIQQRLPQAEIRLLDGAGHFGNDDDPEAWAAAVVEWCLRRR